MRQRLDALQRQKVCRQQLLQCRRCALQPTCRGCAALRRGALRRGAASSAAAPCKCLLNSCACRSTHVLQADAQAQLAEQQGRRQRAAQRAARLLKQAQAATGKLAAGASVEAVVADVQLATVKEGTRGLLEALRAAAAELPELNLLQRVEAEAGGRLPAEASRPGSAAGSPLGAARAQSSCASLPGRGSPSPGSRPGTGLSAAGRRNPAAGRPGSCAGSARSATARGGGSPAPKAPAVQTMQLQL